MAEQPPPPDASPGSATPVWELRRRSRGGRVVAGVCGGLGRHTDIDPLVYRVTFALLAVAAGIGVALYLLAWLFIPGEYAVASRAERVLRRRIDPQVVFPLSLVILGFFLIVTIAGGGIERFLLLAVALVGVLAARARGVDVTASLRTLPAQFRRRERPPRQPYPRPPGPYAAPAAPGPWWSAPTTRQPVPPPGLYPGTTPYPAAPPPQQHAPPLGPPPAYGPATAPYAAGPPTPGTPRPATPRAPRRPRERTLLTPLTLAAATGLAGMLALLGSVGVISAPLPLILGASLVTIGLGLALGTWYGRGPMLVVTGLAVSVALVATTIDIDPSNPFRVGFGDVTWRPTSEREATEPHRLGAGVGNLVLTGLPPSADAYDLRARVGAGDLRVVVPRDATVRVDAYIGSGEVRVPGRTQISSPRTKGGMLVHTQYLIPATSDTAGGSSGRGQGGADDRRRINLTLRVGTGEAVIVRAPA